MPPAQDDDFEAGQVTVFSRIRTAICAYLNPSDFEPVDGPFSEDTAGPDAERKYFKVIREAIRSDLKSKGFSLMQSQLRALQLLQVHWDSVLTEAPTEIKAESQEMLRWCGPSQQLKKGYSELSNASTAASELLCCKLEGGNCHTLEKQATEAISKWEGAEQQRSEDARDNLTKASLIMGAATVLGGVMLL